MRIHSDYLTATALTLAVLGLAGCGSQPQPEMASCELPAGRNVERLFTAASERIGDRHCHYHFDSYRDQLFAAAKGAPGAENEARFAALLRSSIDAGAISQRQGQELFSRYFDPEFYAVKAEPRSTCSSLRDKDRIYSAMRAELADKREGMLEVLDDEARFRRAQRHYSDLNLVLDAVDIACNAAI